MIGCKQKTSDTNKKDRMLTKKIIGKQKDRMQTKKIMQTKKTGCKQKGLDANKKPKPVTMQALT